MPLPWQVTSIILNIYKYNTGNALYILKLICLLITEKLSFLQRIFCWPSWFKGCLNLYKEVQKAEVPSTALLRSTPKASTNMRATPWDPSSEAAAFTAGHPVMQVDSFPADASSKSQWSCEDDCSIQRLGLAWCKWGLCRWWQGKPADTTTHRHEDSRALQVWRKNHPGMWERTELPAKQVSDIRTMSFGSGRALGKRWKRKKLQCTLCFWKHRCKLYFFQSNCWQWGLKNCTMKYRYISLPKNILFPRTLILVSPNLSVSLLSTSTAIGNE